MKSRTRFRISRWRTVWVRTEQFAEPVIVTEDEGWAYLADRIAQAG